MDFRGEDVHECLLDNKNFTLLSEDNVNARISANQLATMFNGFGTARSPHVAQYAILTASMLDRESTPFQQIQIVCTDAARHQTSQNITVYIGDINDHSPVFVKSTLIYQVPENALPGTVLKSDVTTPTRSSLASDADAGKNNVIKYGFADGSLSNENFTIDTFTGTISTRVPFDRESNAKFTFTILAVDQAEGKSALTGTATVQVEVLDVNDNPPVFEQDSYIFQIAENLPRGSPVGQVTASDLDEQGSLTYYLGTDHDASAFEINRKSGEILTRKPLDREKQSNYAFKVMVRDSASGVSAMDKNSFTATATISVVLQDENDNAPVFVLPNATANTLTVAVSQTLGHKLAMIIATDADEGENGRVTYRIKPGNSTHLFSIDPQAGLLFLAESLTRQSDTTFNGTQKDEARIQMVQPLAAHPTIHVLTLEACDSGVDPKCTVFPNLRIHVQPAPSAIDRRYIIGQASETFGMPSNSQQESGGSTGGSEDQHGWGDAPKRGGSSANLKEWPFSQRGGGTGSSEIVIISMSVLFVILLIAILTLTLLVRNCKIGPVKQSPSKQKLVFLF